MALAIRRLVVGVAWGRFAIRTWALVAGLVQFATRQLVEEEGVAEALRVEDRQRGRSRRPSQVQAAPVGLRDFHSWCRNFGGLHCYYHSLDMILPF